MDVQMPQGSYSRIQIDAYWPGSQEKVIAIPFGNVNLLSPCLFKADSKYVFVQDYDNFLASDEYEI